MSKKLFQEEFKITFNHCGSNNIFCAPTTSVWDFPHFHMINSIVFFYTAAKFSFIIILNKSYFCLVLPTLCYLYLSLISILSHYLNFSKIFMCIHCHYLKKVFFGYLNVSPSSFFWGIYYFIMLIFPFVYFASWSSLSVFVLFMWFVSSCYNELPYYFHL